MRLSGRPSRHPLVGRKLGAAATLLVLAVVVEAPCSAAQLADEPAPSGSHRASAAVENHLPSASAQPASPSDSSTTYRLVDTWAGRPWLMTPGNIADPGDITSAPDGTIFVVDESTHLIHVLEPDGEGRALIQPLGRTPSRIDAGADGLLYVLLRGGGVRRFEPEGRLTGEIRTPLSDQWYHTDIAVGADGRIYLPARHHTVDFPSFVEVYENTGRRVDTIELQSLVAPNGEHLIGAWAIDIAADGTIYQEFDLTCCGTGPTATARPRTPMPTATRRPSLHLIAQSDPSPAAPAAQLQDGVLVIGSDKRLQRTVEVSSVYDVAAGTAEGVVSRYNEVLALSDLEPVARMDKPTPLGDYLSFTNARIRWLDITFDSRIHATASSCFLNHAVTFADQKAPTEPTGRRAEALSVVDDPELRGPVFPLRLTAAHDLHLLEGPHRGSFADLGSPYLGHYSVQRWTTDGTLVDQMLVCSSSSFATVDLASAGSDVYTISPEVVLRRPDVLLPAWHYRDEGAYFESVSADEGRVAALDVANQHILLLDEEGQVERLIPIAGPDQLALPVDIALSGDRIYLADQGRNRIVVLGTDGAQLGEWATNDGPKRVATGPGGDVYVLGRGGWGLRYSPEGLLVAFWPLPDRETLEAHDIDVGDDGRIYVHYMHFREPSVGRDYDGVEITAAGVWVFEETVDDLRQPVPSPQACIAQPGKSASPRRVPLGTTADVTLNVDGQCPGRHEPLQLVLVFDTSYSMTYNHALERAQSTVMPLLGSLDLDAVAVGLVTFSDGADLEAQLSSGIGELRARIGSIEADGDTRMGAGIELARIELTGPRRDPDARQVILLVSDGIFKDDPFPAIEAARSDGIDIVSLVYTTREFDSAALETLKQLIGDEENLFIDLPAPMAQEVIDHVTTWHPQHGLFQEITIEDIVPANMSYVAASAVPTAAFDATTRTLTWALSDVAASDGILLRYTLEPLEVGLWPTNVRATSAYRDALGFDGELIFPIPQVDVYKPASVYLPYGANRACMPTRRSLEVSLVVDTSSSMGESAADGKGTKLAAAKEAALSFTDYLTLAIDRVAVIGFDGTARRALGYSGDRAAIRSAIAGLTSHEGTRIDLGLVEARRVLARDAREGAPRIVVLLSDGRHAGDESDVLAAATRLKTLNATVYTIGLGDGADAELLQTVATSPDRYFASPSTDELLSIYLGLLQWIACDTR